VLGIWFPHCLVKHAAKRCHLLLDGVLGFVDYEPLCVDWLVVDIGQQPRIVISPNFDSKKLQFAFFLHLVGEIDEFVWLFRSSNKSNILSL
jgi:hypothetical protein